MPPHLSEAPLQQSRSGDRPHEAHRQSRNQACVAFVLHNCLCALCMLLGLRLAQYASRGHLFSASSWSNHLHPGVPRIADWKADHRETILSTETSDLSPDHLSQRSRGTLKLSQKRVLLAGTQELAQDLSASDPPPLPSWPEDPSLSLIQSPSVCQWDVALHWSYSPDLMGPVPLYLLGPNGTLRGSSKGAKGAGDSDAAKRPFMVLSGGRSNKSRVGKHGILVRANPQPHPPQVLQAYSLLSLIQEVKMQQQERLQGLPSAPALSQSQEQDPVLPLGHEARPPMRQRLLVVTTTWVRTFQKVHMLGLINSLRSARSPLLWIVAEGGKKPTAETRALIRGSGLPFVHLAAGNVSQAATWQGRERLEFLLRLQGLRHVHEQRLQGRVVFTDDSTVMAPAFFMEAQRVQHMGALGVGILMPQGYPQMMRGEKRRKADKSDPQPDLGADATQGEGAEELDGGAVGVLGKAREPVQAPVCAAGVVTGWHTVVHSPDWVEKGGGVSRYAASVDEAQERASLVWTGFVVNAELLWRDKGAPLLSQAGTGAEEAQGQEAADVDRVAQGKNSWPDWVRPWREWAPEAEAALQGGQGRQGAQGGQGGQGAQGPVGGSTVEEGSEPGRDQGQYLPSILDLLVTDESRVEPLKECSREVLAWWYRSEARPDSKFPPRWHVPALDIVAPSKKTPWGSRKFKRSLSHKKPHPKPSPL